jgi:hypothetical protein
MKVVALLLCLLASSFTGAQQSSAAPAATATAAPATQASREEILQLFQVLRLQKQMEEMQKTMSAQMEQMFESMSKEQSGKLTPEQREKMNSVMKDYLRQSQNIYPVSEMVSDMVPVYQRNLTSDDVHAISAFYQSPAGQRYLDKAPRMLQDTMATIMPKMQERLKQQMASMSKKMQQVMEEPAAPNNNESKH